MYNNTGILFVLILLLLSCQSNRNKTDSIDLTKYFDTTNGELQKKNEYCNTALSLNSNCETLTQLIEMDSIPYLCTMEIILKFEKLTGIPSKVRFHGSTAGILFENLDSLKSDLEKWRNHVCK
jgi:hypothetical protein